jgi:hypothetical protein
MIGGVLLFGMFFLYGYSLSTFRTTDEYAPRGAVEFLRREAAQGLPLVLFNEYGWGGYLTLYAPELRVFIDGRMPHWRADDGSSAMSDYVRALLLSSEKEEQDSWREILRRRGVTTVLLRRVKQVEPNEQNQGWFSGVMQHVTKSPAVRLIVERFVNKEEIRAKEENNLHAKLMRHGWAVVYEDEQAVVLSCYGEACY